MYDKKTWIVVSLCSVLMAYTMYDMNKKGQIAAKEREQQQKQEDFNSKALEAKNPKPDLPAADNGEVGKTLPAVAPEEKLIVLETPEVAFSLTTLGAGVKFASLKNEYEIGDKKIPIHINNDGKNPVAALTNGPNTFDSLLYAYDEKNSVAGKSAVFIAKTPEGLIVKKSFSLIDDDSKPGAAYLLNFEVVIENTNATPVALNQWTLALGSAGPIHAKEWPAQTTYFYHDDQEYKFIEVTSFKGNIISSDKSQDEKQLAKASLAGVCDQFFTIALKCSEPYPSSVIAHPYDVPFAGLEKPLQGVSSYLRLPTQSLAQGEQKKLSFQIYMGPKDNNMLRKMGEQWGDIMNYGVFSPISRFLNFILHWIHKVISIISSTWSWGISIIVLTLCVRTAIWPLYNKSNRSMKRMAKLKPEMDKIKEKYPSDPTKVNQEVMKLYKKYGVNPIGGCLPMLLQIPIFFGFYRMLQYAVELRHEPFLWWVNDLSQPDTIGHLFGYPINLLPIIMTLTSFAQMAMMPKTGDKMQQRMMMFMPFVFLIFCYSFASALALYWTTQNIFTIFQTWLTSKMPEPVLKEKPAGPVDPSKPQKKSFMERMMEKQEELQQQQANRNRADNSGDLRDVTPKKRPPKTGG